MALSSTCLVTLGRVREYLNFHDASTILEPITEAVSDHVEKVLNRKIKSQSFSELYPWCGERGIILHQPDVTEIGLLALEADDALKVKYSGSDTNARAEVTSTAFVLTSRAASTTTTTTKTLSDAANDTITELVSVIGAVSGWTATLINAGPSAYLMQTGSRSTKDCEQTFKAWRWWDGEYQTDYQAGIIRLNEAGFWNTVGQVRVDYTAGFSSVPDDVQLFVLEKVKEAWEAKNRDGAIKSESDGDYSYTLVDRQPWDDECTMRLSRYRRFTV